MKDYYVLVINPGSTSTKIGLFQNDTPTFEKTIYHDASELKQYKTIIDQYSLRKQTILQTLSQEEIDISRLDAVCGRGGLLKPIEGGTYEVNDMMLKDLKEGYLGQHASNLGGILAFEIASSLNIPAFIVDPVVVDELEPIARLSGVPFMERKSIFHALNQKAVSRRAAEQFNKKYEDLNLIVVHMGGGITVGVHRGGKVVDVNNGLHGDGPFSPERAGTVPAGDLVDLCYSGQYQRDEIMRMLVGEGGLVGYLGTSDARKVEAMIKEGDSKAKLVYEGMAYQIAKEIGAASVVLNGRVDAIILTGGLAYAKQLVSWIVGRVNWIADVIVYEGENELQALAEGALRVLRNNERVKEYPGDRVKTAVF